MNYAAKQPSLTWSSCTDVGQYTSYSLYHQWTYTLKICVPLTMCHFHNILTGTGVFEPFQLHKLSRHWLSSRWRPEFRLWLYQKFECRFLLTEKQMVPNTSLVVFLSRFNVVSICPLLVFRIKWILWLVAFASWISLIFFRTSEYVISAAHTMHRAYTN